MRHFAFLQKSQFWSKQHLLDFQWKCLKKLLEYSYENTEYYRTVMDERGLIPASFKSFDDFKLLPVLTRDITFEKHDQFFSKKYKKEDLQRFMSGGTTGQQAVLYRDQESFNIKLALAWRHEHWMGKLPGDKIAHIWPAAMDIHETESFKSRLKYRHLMRIVVYNAGGFDRPSLELIQHDLLQFTPSYLKVFPSALYGFTEFCLENNLSVPRVKAIMSTGEILYPGQRKLFEDTFHCPVIDMYGSREVGNTSCECEAHKGMHIAMETSVVEFIKDNKPVEFGEEGEMLITDLTNFGFPLIRYAINDYGVPMKDDCSCGRGLIRMDKAIGRLIDMLYRSDGTKISGNVLGIALTFEGPEIGQTQIIQKSFTDFVIKITDRPQPTQDIFDYIDQTMKKHMGESINLTIEVVKEIPKEKSGKVRFAKCEIEQPDGINR